MLLKWYYNRFCFLFRLVVTNWPSLFFTVAPGWQPGVKRLWKTSFSIIKFKWSKPHSPFIRFRLGNRHKCTKKFSFPTEKSKFFSVISNVLNVELLTSLQHRVPKSILSYLCSFTVKFKITFISIILYNTMWASVQGIWKPQFLTSQSDINNNQRYFEKCVNDIL